jgi:hypothetical protein
MAIFGDLSEFPFPEVLNMLGRRTGKLELFELPSSEPVEIHLREGTLCGLVVGDDLLDDVLHVRDKLRSLMQTTTGAFEFHAVAQEELDGQLDMPLQQLLMSLASAIDEISHYKNRFTHPKTRFKWISASDIWISDELYFFCERARPYLKMGTDAETLTRDLNLSLDQVQLCLYKLRSVGAVAPVRAFVESVTSASQIRNILLGIEQPAPAFQEEAFEPPPPRATPPPLPAATTRPSLSSIARALSPSAANSKPLFSVLAKYEKPTLLSRMLKALHLRRDK